MKQKKKNVCIEEWFHPILQILHCRMRLNIMAFLTEVLSVWNHHRHHCRCVYALSFLSVCSFLYSYKIFMFSYLAHPIVMVLSIFSHPLIILLQLSFLLSSFRVFFLFFVSLRCGLQFSAYNRILHICNNFLLSLSLFSFAFKTHIQQTYRIYIYLSRSRK